MEMVEMVELRNGSKEEKVLVAVTFMVLEELLEDSLIAFYEAAQIALNPDYKPFGSSAHALTERGLLENGKMRDDIRNVVRSSVVGEGMDLFLRNPLR